MFIAYNLRRIINILDADILKKFFQELSFFLLGIFALAKAFRLHIPHTNFRTKFSVFLILPPSYPLKFDYICSRMGVLRRIDVTTNRGGQFSVRQFIVDKKHFASTADFSHRRPHSSSFASTRRFR